MEEVRRESDDELCGHVVPVGDRWHAATVFGGVLGVCPTRTDAVALVLAAGLASLTEVWTLQGADLPQPDGEVVRITQASPSSVTVALGFYSLPGVPTMTVSRADLAVGRYSLRLGSA